MTLSTNAAALYDYLKKTGGAWMQNCFEAIASKPTYKSEPEAQRAYWQYEANMYGQPCERPVGSDHVIFTPTDNYSVKTGAAYQELRKLGLAGERNNGYNEYWIYPKK